MHVIEDFEDIEGDKTVGIKTLPISLGKKECDSHIADDLFIFDNYRTDRSNLQR